jgi:hypothetical protein
MVGDELGPARREGDALRDHLVDDRRREAPQQRDALAQRRLEGDLAAHGARSVIAATRSFRPSEAASSSMHSWPIMVESMSAISSALAAALGRQHRDVDGGAPVRARSRSAQPRVVRVAGPARRRSRRRCRAARMRGARCLGQGARHGPEARRATAGIGADEEWRRHVGHPA